MIRPGNFWAVLEIKKAQVIEPFLFMFLYYFYFLHLLYLNLINDALNKTQRHHPLFLEQLTRYQCA